MAHTRTIGGIATLALAASMATGGCSGGGDSPASTATGTSSTGAAGGGSGGSSTGSGPTTTSSTSSTGGAGGASATSTGPSTGAGGSGTSTGSGSGGAGGSGSGGGNAAPPTAFKCNTAAPNATAPAAQWVNATGNLANMASECGNLTMLSAEPCTNAVIAGVAKGGLWATSDGKTWTKLGSGAGSAAIVNRPSSVVYDPEHENVFWASGIYNGGGLYKTTDNGQTFKQLGTISHNDLVSVDFNDPDRKTILVGGHEQKRKLYLSTDGGQTFNDIGMNLPADSHFSSAPQVLDSKTFLLGACGWGDGTCGVYRSTDTGASWSRVSDQTVVARPLWTRDDTMYWSNLFDGGIATSADQGRTWAKAAGGIASGYPVELPDGRVLTVGNGHVVVSKDKGKTWTQVGPNPPFKPIGVTYSVRTKTVFIWKADCGNVVLPDAIASMGFDYTTQ